MEKRIGKRDIVLLIVILAAALVIFFAFRVAHRESGAQVKVTVDGEVYGIYDLNSGDEKAFAVDITIDGSVTNTLVIQDGKADMTQADCPDKLCVHQRAISKAGETIVCLPNKVVAEVIGDSGEPEFDAIAK